MVEVPHLCFDELIFILYPPLHRFWSYKLSA